MSDSTPTPTTYSDSDSADRALRYQEEIERLPTRSLDEHRTRSRRSVLFGGAAAAAGLLGWRWILEQPVDRRIPGVLRTGHEVNEAIWSGLFREDHLARTFPDDEASILRINGRHGIRSDIDLDTWQLDVRNDAGDLLGTHTLDDIRGLPAHDMTIEHKCVEGWSQVTNWGGARFSDFAELYADQLDHSYVALVTPDRDYFVGLDMETMLHPQTLLAYEMLGQPLDLEHGAPLRLATPLKYGIKQIKRIGTITFTNVEPDDYWAQRGYDFYSGL